MRLLAVLCLFFAAMTMGCCGPMGCGPGCNLTTGCNDCDGLAAGHDVIPYGPLENLRQLKRNVVCGSGCGEVYVGEWISTPPDVADPCVGGEYVGGCGGKCQPFCWQPGTIVGGLFGGLAGQRFCTGAESSAPCGCGPCDDGCCGDGVVMDGSGSCGCTACNETVMPATRTARQPMISSQAMDARVNHIRR